jgi:endonuclease/exonuclease/phosphatase family metal-dependent hydrolase
MKDVLGEIAKAARKAALSDDVSELEALKNLYNSTSERKIAEKNLEWQYRFPKMQEIIRKHDPDILVFQEMDHFQEFVGMLFLNLLISYR